MIDIFESTAQLRPEAVFFTAVDRRGNETAYTYRQARLIASQLARRLRDKGVFPGDVVAVDLPNGPMYVFLALAAAYGGFALVALNHRLTDAEKLTRVLELERAGLRVAYTVDAAGEPKLFEAVCNSLLRNERAGRVDDSLGGSVEDAIHFAERAAHVFDSSHRALIMFTSGTTGKPKAAELTWGNLVEASKASNRVLSGRVRGRGLWQAVLPFFHVGGFQVLVRSVCSRWPLRIYERFDAAAVLRALRTLYAPDISDGRLETLAARLGSDVPFFIRGGTQLATGRGEVVSPLPQLAAGWFVVVKPDEGYSTAEMYRRLDEPGSVLVRNSRYMQDAVAANNVHAVAVELHNSFERVVPKDSSLRTIKDALREQGALGTLLSGSGSAVFGLFDDQSAAAAAAVALKKTWPWVFVARPV